MSAIKPYLMYFGDFTNLIMPSVPNYRIIIIAQALKALFHYGFPYQGFQFPNALHIRVFPTLGFPVKDGLTIQIHLQTTIIHWCYRNCYSSLELREKFGRYPSGLR